MKKTLLSVALLVALVGCSGARKKADPEPNADAPDIQAGAQRWVGGALFLPRDTPVVIEGRLDRVLDAGARLKQWVLDEPAMLGEDGEETARAIELAWAGISTYIGADPLTPRAWTSRGVDVSRPVFVAAYPIGENERQFVRAVDAQLRAELGVPPGGSIGTALRTLVATAGSLPEGANARVLRAVEGRRPLGGLRVVVPVTTPVDFLATVAGFAEGMGFEKFPPELAADLKVTPLERAYWSDSSIPGLAVRIEGSHAIVDVLFPAFFGGVLTARDPEQHMREVYDDLRFVLDDVGAGRPRAPRAPDDPVVGVSFDQPRTADLVRLRGYREALQSLQTARAEKRDALLLASLLRSVAEADAWEVGSKDLTGLSYSVRTGSAESNEVARLVMTLFGRKDLPALGPATSHPSLGVHDHSASLAVTFDPMYSDAWKAWFVGETTTALGALDPALIATPRIGLPGARVFALLFASIGDRAALAELSQTFAAGVAELYGIRHLETVVLTSDVEDFRQHPRLVVAAVFDPRDDLVVRTQAVLDYTLAVAIHAFDGPDEIPRTPAPSADTTHAVIVDGMPPLHYRLAGGPTAPYLLIGVGITSEELDAQLETMTTTQSEPHVLLGRIEPVALLSWLRLDDADLFDPIDPNILAQRLGPVILQFAPDRAGTSNTVSLDLILEKPPKL